MKIHFLTLGDALALHARQIRRFGGSPGLRDQGLLESALAQPQASFAGRFAHADLFEMAAAYLFHLTSNHPFVDGNKRVGLAAALAFLDINGFGIRAGTRALCALTMATARGEVARPEIAETLRRLAGQGPDD